MQFAIKLEFLAIEFSSAVLGNCHVVCMLSFIVISAILRSCFLSAWKHHSAAHAKSSVDVTSAVVNAEEGEMTASDFGPEYCADDEEWVLLSESGEYAPTADDIGCAIRLEVTAFGYGNSVDPTQHILATTVRVTDPVLAAPLPAPQRPLVSLPVSSTSAGTRCRIVSYNILAEIYATKQVGLCSVCFSYFYIIVFAMLNLTGVSSC